MSNRNVMISPEMEKLINQVSKNNNISREHAFKRALALLKISEEQKKKGNMLGIIKEINGDLEIVGKIEGL
ncbi:hypothetical protein ACTOJ1_000474 [Shigella flexneri]